ncbi:MAG: ATP-dependent RecD-like DNA helicase [Capsulimonadaceae bacterium]|nr:ATP-dependent RecD-like DNA helicase [Capsulimonadaceae bacterium]
MDLGQPLDEVRGVLERVTFHNEENGYTVARLLPEGSREVVTVLGNFADPVVGEFLRCEGIWKTHPKWGPQMQVQRYEAIRPASVDGIRRYLGSGMVKGVGPVMAGRIVDVFGERALDIIDKEPRRLLEVAGIGEKRVELIRKAWYDQREIRNVMLFLQSHGVSPAYAVKIYKTYGTDSIAIVERNPYQLATDIWGIGFKSADQIAGNLGFAKDDPRRIEAGLIYVMNQTVETGGNAFLTRDELAAAAGEILGATAIDECLDKLVEREQLVSERISLFGVEEEAIYTPVLHTIETHLAGRLKRMSARPVSVGMSDVELSKWIAELVARQGVALSGEQAAAVSKCVTSRVSVLTGGPGTGKTTTTRILVAALHALEKRVLLASPTGRAAKRLSEAAGAPATTIHRMLVYDPASRAFRFGAENTLECDVLIVDEASMLDMVLANAVVRALAEDTQLILVGDVDQLPSVGPGNVLCDIIDSGVAPVARLTQVFRQAALSTIITNAHAVNQGRMPDLPSPREPDRDFVFVQADEAEDAAAKAVAVVARSLPRRGHDPADIQVLVPMQKGAAGAINLNALLQQTLNPPLPGRPEVSRSARIFRLGDRVIQMRNNYDKGVFNGEIGVIAGIDAEAATVLVRMAEQDVVYEFSDLDELSLAYALTIHKSQGSEFSVAVIVLHTQHYALLQRNLLYTAITRAKRYAVVVGNKRALSIAVRNDKQAERHTRLRARMQGLIAST